MRKGLPSRWNQFPTQRPYTSRQVYLTRFQRLMGTFRRKLWHGGCNR
jgi:hypothetical protein